MLVFPQENTEGLKKLFLFNKAGDQTIFSEQAAGLGVFLSQRYSELSVMYKKRRFSENRLCNE
jgi:hypothetical protein